MVRVYDRPLLRSSARGDGALWLVFDRFAVGHTGRSWSYAPEHRNRKMGLVEREI